jgi:hypothetical protein
LRAGTQLSSSKSKIDDTDSPLSGTQRDRTPDLRSTQIGILNKG